MYEPLQLYAMAEQDVQHQPPNQIMDMADEIRVEPPPRERHPWVKAWCKLVGVASCAFLMWRFSEEAEEDKETICHMFSLEHCPGKRDTALDVGKVMSVVVKYFIFCVFPMMSLLAFVLVEVVSCRPVWARRLAVSPARMHFFATFSLLHVAVTAMADSLELFFSTSNLEQSKNDGMDYLSSTFSFLLMFYMFETHIACLYSSHFDMRIALERFQRMQVAGPGREQEEQ